MSLTDEQMWEALSGTRPYTVVILTKTALYGTAEGKRAVWEHGRRNFDLRASGRLAVVCPVADDSAVSGVGIFATDEGDTRALMDDDPAVRAGVFDYHIHPTRSFPGDALPT